MDVEQLYEEMEQMENKDKSGFFVELTNLKGKVVYIVFYAGNTKSVHGSVAADSGDRKKSKNMQKRNPLLENTGKCRSCRKSCS